LLFVVVAIGMGFFVLVFFFRVFVTVCCWHVGMGFNACGSIVALALIAVDRV
jgi:hypothetical protein